MLGVHYKRAVADHGFVDGLASKKQHFGVVIGLNAQATAVLRQCGHLRCAQHAAIDLHSAVQHHQQGAPAFWLRHIDGFTGGQTQVPHLHGRIGARRATLAGLIGTGLGICNPYNLRIILEEAKIPVLVDAGVGTASDAAVAMELGCDGVLMNTAIAEAKDPIRMARAMKLAVEAGRDAYLSGRMATRKYADPSSPLAGLI